MVPTLEVVTASEISARIAALEARAGVPIDELRRLADLYELSQEGQAILRKMEDLSYLQVHVAR
jgi:DNA-binding transcriptional LysR family regulator